MTLTEELQADQGKPTQCAFCAWLRDLGGPEREEWDEAVATAKFTHASLLRAARRRGFTSGFTSLSNHRNAGHLP